MKSAFTPRRALSRVPGALAVAVSVALLGMHFGAAPAPPARASDGVRSDAILASVAPAPFGGFRTHSDDTDTSQAGTHALNGAHIFPGQVKSGTSQTKTASMIADTRGLLVADPSNPDDYYIVSEFGQIARYSWAPKPSPWDYDDLEAEGYNTWDSITAVAMTPSGEGMWLADYRGNVWTLGDAQSYGDANPGVESPTAIVPTPSGKGYYILEVDGGVHGRGDAEQALFGSTGGNRPNGKDVLGMALSLADDGTTVNGYWLVDEAGGVHTYGAARFLGSTGGNSPDVVGGMTRLPGNGYALVHTNGRVEAFHSDGRITDHWPTG